MIKFTTKIKAIDYIDGELKTWGGPIIEAISYKDAEYFCQENGLGYCEVDGILVSEIPTKSDGVTPDWKNRKDFDNKAEFN